MKKIYTFLSLILTSVMSVAQVSIEPNPVFVTDFSFTDFEIVGYSTVIHEGDEPTTYTWTRTIIEMTEGWECAICDRNMCYAPWTDSESFYMAVGDEGNLDTHIYPGNSSGNAIVAITVVDDANPSNVVVGVYFFDQMLGVSERLTERIKIFPNPVIDFLYIESGKDVGRIEIFNIEGRLVYSEQVNGKNSINLGSLTRGNYVVRMFDAANNQVSSNLLVKA